MLVQCVANIRMFEYIRILIDKCIHSPKYSWIFSKQIYLDIHLRLFSPLEYIRTLIWIVRFQLICSNVFIEQNKTCYSKNVKQSDLSFVKCNIFYHKNWLIFSNQIFFVHSFVSILNGQIYSDIHSWKMLTTEYLRTFIYEYFALTNTFGYSFVKEKWHLLHTVQVLICWWPSLPGGGPSPLEYPLPPWAGGGLLYSPLPPP